MNYENEITNIIGEIKKLTKDRDYETAIKLCEKEEYNNIESIQFEYVKLLRKSNKYTKGLEICDKYPLNPFFQSQKVKILILQEKYDEALIVCNKFKDNKVIQSQKRNILTELSKSQNQLKGKNNNSKIKSNILTKIYYNEITEDDILNSDLNDHDKSILLIAYYEKNNKQKGIKFVNERKRQVTLIEDKKLLNKLLEKLICKKSKNFDVLAYCAILECGIMYKESNKPIIKDKVQTKQVVKECEIVKKNININDTEVKEKQSIISVQGKKVTNENNVSSHKEVQQQKNVCRNILIKDIFSNELLEIEKYIYLEMGNPKRQRDAVKAWDILESLSYKPITDKEAVKKMIHLIEVHSKSTRTIKYDEKKYSKYL